MDNFEYRIAMSGTPNSNTILDVWHPAYLIDDGERLGKRFYGFRSAVCPTPVQWIRQCVGRQTRCTRDCCVCSVRYQHPLLSRRVYRHAQTGRVYTVRVDLNKKTMDAYKVLAEDSVLYTPQGTINAVHAGAKVKKLLQLCTGAVYDEHGKAQGIHAERYDRYAASAGA